MFRRIARGREDLHRDLTAATFEAAWALHFRLFERMPVPGTSRMLSVFAK